MTMTLGDRIVLATDGIVALAELLDGERESVLERCEKTWNEDPDDRPMPGQLVERWVALLEVATGALLGVMVWRALPYGDTVSSIAWNIGAHLLPAVRGRGLSTRAGRMLVRHLFATTDAYRLEANTDVANVAGWRGLERVGFQREGVTRGVRLSGGERRDWFMHSLLRPEADGLDGERPVFGRRDGVVLARALPEDRSEISARSDGAFSVDSDTRLPPVSPPAVYRGAVLDEDSWRLLGMVSWHAVDYGGTFGCAAWNIGIELATDARGRGVGSVAQRLLAEHLFATTQLDRVEAGTDVDNVAELRALEKAGFQLDGVVRGAQLRGGVRRDLALYGILRADLA